MTTYLPIASADHDADCCDDTTDCCRTAGPALPVERATEVAALFKALGDPARVRLLATIATSATGEVCICDLTGPFDLTQPTLSHHLRTLTTAGLVAREQRGRWAYFSLTPDARDLVGAAVRAALPAGETPSGTDPDPATGTPQTPAATPETLS